MTDFKSELREMKLSASRTFVQASKLGYLFELDDKSIDDIIALFISKVEQHKSTCTCKAVERGAYMHKLTCFENHNIGIDNFIEDIKRASGIKGEIDRE